MTMTDYGVNVYGVNPPNPVREMYHVIDARDGWDRNFASIGDLADSAVIGDILAEQYFGWMVSYRPAGGSEHAWRKVSITELRRKVTAFRERRAKRQQNR